MNNNILRNTLSYMGYTGSIKYSATNNIFYGKILNIKKDVSYSGESVKDLEQEFIKRVDEYLKD